MRRYADGQAEMKSEALHSDAVSTDQPLGPHVLVVEDDPHTAYLLEFMLQREGFRTTISPDGRDALGLIDTIDPPDLVLLDLMMPYASGFQVLQSLRGTGEWMDVPVIIISAKVLERDITQAFDMGADDYVTKPFRPGELLARVRRNIDVARRLRASHK